MSFMSWGAVASSQASGAAAVDITFVDDVEDDTNGSTRTFSSASIGSPADGDIVLVTIATQRATSGAWAISSVTLGGYTMDEIIQHRDGGVDNIAAIYAIRVTSGSTPSLVSAASADIVINLNASGDRCWASTYVMTGKSATTAADTGYDGASSSLAATVNVPTNGALVAVNTFVANSGTGTTTYGGDFAGTDKDWDTLSPEATKGEAAGGHKNLPAGNATFNAAISFSTSLNNSRASMAVATFGPG